MGALLWQDDNSYFDFSYMCMYYMRFLKDTISFSFPLFYSANFPMSEKKRTFNFQESVFFKFMSVKTFFMFKKPKLLTVVCTKTSYKNVSEIIHTLGINCASSSVSWCQSLVSEIEI